MITLPLFSFILELFSPTKCGFVLTIGYVLDGFPSLCEDWLSMAEQLELVKNLTLLPDFIINLKVL